MLNDKRIVCMTPAGRRRYMRLLVPMVLSNTLIDEYQIWINTTDAGDLAFLRGLKDIPRVKVIEQPKGVVNGNASISDFFVHAADPDTIYIRFDDDIVWMEADTIEKIVDARVADTQSFLVAPVVVNNAVCTNILQNRGIFDTAPYVSSYVMDHVGWGDANFAERLHRHFISSFIDTKQTDRLDIGRQVIGCTRFSINCISWFGEALSSVSDQIGMDDEEFLSCIHPARNGLYNTIVGDTRVAHFAFCTQRDGLDTSDVLARYAIIFNEMDWVDREVAAMVDAACKVGDEIAQHQTYSRKGGSEYASPGLNASTNPAQLLRSRRLPKVFAIGMPRTGTTSLHYFFGMLGLKARHLDMELCNMIGRGDYNLADIDNYDAFSDSTYSYIWKDLYYIWPNARFIITTRPDQLWLRSIEKLAALNRHFGVWDDRPANADQRNFLTMFFGSPDFDSSIWLSAYRRHRLETRSFFRNLPEDKFLEVEMVEERNVENAHRVAKFLGIHLTEPIEMPVRNKGEVEYVGRL